MVEEKITLSLTSQEMQQVEEALLDKDGGLALQILRRTIKPQMDRALKRQLRGPTDPDGGGFARV